MIQSSSIIIQTMMCAQYTAFQCLLALGDVGYFADDISADDKRNQTCLSYASTLGFPFSSSQSFTFPNATICKDVSARKIKVYPPTSHNQIIQISAP